MKRTLALLFLAACGVPPEHAAQPLAARPRTSAPTGPCEVARNADDLHATRDGVVLVEKGLAQRYTAVGCGLVPDGSAPVAVSAVLAVDGAGNVFAYGSDARQRGVVATLRPGERAESMVLKVTREGAVAPILATGRGIWGFGVSPAGGALWFEGCAPGGVYALHADDTMSLVDRPPTLWAQMDGAFTDDETFFSVGYRTCTTPGVECGYDLMRTTRDGTVSVGTTIFGTAHAQLAPCGPRLCGLLEDAIAIWNGDGALVATLPHARLGVRDGERIARVTGNAQGLYLLLRSADATRVVFSPVAP